MTHARTRTAAALAAGVLLLAPLAGCGGDDEKSGSKAPAASSAPQAVDKDVLLTQVAAATNGEDSVHVEIGGSLITASGDVVYEGNASRVALKAELMGQDTTMILAGKSLYILQTNGKYLRYGTDNPMFGALLKGFADIGPRGVVTGIRPGVTQVVDLGEKEVAGEKVTAYKVTVDTKKAGSVFQLLAGAGVKSSTIALDMYVGEDKLPRRIATEVDGQKVELTFSDWGKKVTVDVPSDADLMN